MKRNETGRSLVEMLGVLAVIGVLAVVAVLGFRYGMNKVKANGLYNDVKIVYMSSGANTPYEWTQAEYDSISGYELLVRRDKASNDFVLVEAVEKDVCKLILDLAENDVSISLYTQINELMECKEEMQNIVFAFNGMAPLLPCGGVEDCPEAYNSYCSSDEKVCLSCALGQRKNNTGTGCLDLCSDREDIYTQTCTSEEDGVNWCCPFESVCSNIPGKCIDSSKVCVYDMKETNVAEMYYTATCSYTMKETAAAEMYYTATCGYNLQQTTGADGNIDVSFSKIGNTCPSDHYCRLTWTEKTWTGSTAPTGFANDYTGDMWGVCVPMSTTTANAQPVYSSSDNLLVRKNMKCPANHYCRLTWTKEKWSGTAPTGFNNDYVGDMFGVCVPMSTTTANAQPVYSSTESLMSRKTDCPDGQYCNLRWTTTENNCSNASIPNDYVGLMYGECVDLNKVNTATCPSSMPGIMVP
ncbi:MAG: hypothetical protein IKV03_04955 [Alphaproteobacteria bacterium]|nr:hypothetical protein [Alphaproteobacteria bacterium]